MSRDDEVGSTGSFLNGVKVIELADELGEYCGKVLAGLGADVVKVEPVGGEKTRENGPFYGDVADPNRSLYFWHFNFGKRSAVLDLDVPVDRADFESLVASADVLLDTRHRDYLAERGISYDELASLNPGLIYVRISPFGDTGPWADFVANDLVQLALGGVVMNCGYDADLRGEYDTPPVAPQMWHAYQVAGEVTAVQIIAALCYRNVTGRGQQITTSVHEAVSGNTEQDTPDWVYARQPHVRRTCGHSIAQTVDSPQEAARRAASDPAILPTKDGRWILPYTSYIKVQGSTKLNIPDAIDRLLTVIKSFGASDDFIASRFHDVTYRATPEFVGQLNALLAKFINRTRFGDDVWLVAQELGLAWAPLRRPEENLADDHWKARETFAEVLHPDLGRTFTEIGAKWLSPGLPWRTGPAAPLIGEHTAEVVMDARASASADRAQRPKVAVDQRRQTTVISKLDRPFALAGVRIVDLSWALASAGGGRFFTALGAEVIKIEHDSKLDGMRQSYGRVPVGGREERDRARGPLLVPLSESPNRSGAFMETNAGKLSVSLDLKTAEGKVILEDLIAEADIVVEGFSPGTFERMGFGYENLRRIKQDIIYVQQSGPGQIGTHGRLRTFGPSAQALSGLSEMSGLPEPYPPAGIGYSYLDWFGAYHIAMAMMAALYRRDQTGLGCWIDSSQVEAGIYLTGTAVLDFSANGQRWQRHGNRSWGRPAAPHGIYRTAGHDRWIAIAAFSEEHWRSLTAVLQRSVWNADPRLATLGLRVQNQDHVDELIGDAVAGWDAMELMEQLQAQGVPAGVCQTAEDRCESDPQLRHLGWMQELTQSEIGTWPVKGIPVKMSETPPYIGGIFDRHGPSYGEDTDRVLRERLSLSDAELSRLRVSGVI